MSFKVGGGFLTNGRVAWGLGPLAEMYQEAEGGYLPPPGWTFMTEIQAEGIHPQGYFVVSRPAEDAG